VTTQGESKISRAILTELRKAGAFAFKVHGGPMMMVGLPDIVACVDGRFVCFETKTPEKRKNVSKAQARIHELITRAGGVAVVVCGPTEALGIIGELRLKTPKHEQRTEPQGDDH
jgi:Holliday junction resolvase